LSGGAGWLDIELFFFFTLDLNWFNFASSHYENDSELEVVKW
jgi:hypothetical protein